MLISFSERVTKSANELHTLSGIEWLSLSAITSEIILHKTKITHLVYPDGTLI